MVVSIFAELIDEGGGWTRVVEFVIIGAKTWESLYAFRCK